MTILNGTTEFKLAVETTVGEMVLGKVFGCVVVAVWLLAMTAKSGIEIQFDLISGGPENDSLDSNL